MENYSMFELAGYTKEESEQLIEICDFHEMHYEYMISILKAFGVPKNESIEALNKL